MMREDDSQQKELLKKETAHIAQMFQKHFDAIREQRTLKPTTRTPIVKSSNQSNRCYP